MCPTCYHHAANLGEYHTHRLPRGATRGSARVLPVYYDDNYVSLLPGESRRIEVLCPAGSGQCARVALRGWNAEAREIAVESASR